MTALSVGFSSCGGGGSSNSSSNPFEGTWKPTEKYFVDRIVIKYGVEAGDCTVVLNDKSYLEGRWERIKDNYDKFNKIIIRPWGDCKLVIDDNGTTGTLYETNGTTVAAKMKKVQ